jgi:hypothetical protein
VPTWWTSKEFEVAIQLAAAIGTLSACVVAAIALFQIRIAARALSAARGQLEAAKAAVEVAKDDIRIRCKREAAALAAERCQEFAERLLPQGQGWIRSIRELGVELKPWREAPLNLDDRKFLEAPEAVAWLKSVSSKAGVSGHMSDLLNSLESFAIYFTSGAADEEVAYPAIGNIYCKWVEYFAPHLIAVRSNAVRGVTTGQFVHTVTLYATWTARARRDQLHAEQTKIQDQLSRTPDRRIPPVGL